MDEPTTQSPGRSSRPQNDTDHLGIKEVAASLKVSEGTVLRWIDAGKLNGFFRIGRKWLIRKADFEQLINQRVVESKE
mgnify:CR=1 FL=1